MKATVLGGGLVGSAIARDLAANGEFSVRLCDISDSVLRSFSGQEGIEVLKTDLSAGREYIKTHRIPLNILLRRCEFRGRRLLGGLLTRGVTFQFGRGSLPSRAFALGCASALAVAI